MVCKKKADYCFFYIIDGYNNTYQGYNMETHFLMNSKHSNYLIDTIDFDLQQLISSINLTFNLQSHRLNEVMKTLTVFSVIFIPLRFLAGIYGMNFKNIPELESQNSCYILLAIMIIITIGIVIYFKRKKWF